MSTSRVVARLRPRLRAAPFSARPCMRSSRFLSPTATVLKASTSPLLCTSLCSRQFSSGGSLPSPPSPLLPPAPVAIPAEHLPSAAVTPSPPSEPLSSRLAPLDSALPAEASMTASAPDALLQDIADFISPDHIIPALQYGDLSALGLVSWTPAGLSRWLLELIQVSTGLPWFHTIVGFVVVTRLALVPLQIISMRHQMRLVPITPELERIRAEISAATDMLSKRRAALKQSQLYERAGVKLSVVTALPIATMITQIGVWMGIRKLCELPLEQMTVSGVSFLPDLTVPDPMFAILASLSIQGALLVARRDLTTVGAGHFMNVAHPALLVLGTWFLTTLPAGLSLTVLVGSVIQTAQAWVLRKPSVRHVLNIPVLAARQKIKAPTPMESWRKYISPLFEKSIIPASTAKRTRTRR